MQKNSRQFRPLLITLLAMTSIIIPFITPDYRQYSNEDLISAYEDCTAIPFLTCPSCELVIMEMENRELIPKRPGGILQFLRTFSAWSIM